MRKNDMVFNMLDGSAKTKAQIASALGGVSMKTVKNRLGEIHREINDRNKRRVRGKCFAVLDDHASGTRRYAILDSEYRYQDQVEHGTKAFTRSGKNKLKSDGYPTVVFERY